MTLNDLLKRVTDEDKEKVIIITDFDKKGWSNVDVSINDTTIVISPDFCMPFDD